MIHTNRPLLIGLTGGIASGKSSAANYLIKKGFDVIFSDNIAHEILEEKEIVSKLVELFGEGILSNNKIDRSALGMIVFSDSKGRRKLNNLIHPKVKEKIQQSIDNYSGRYLFIEIPLLFEINLDKCFDIVINIYSTIEMQIKRLIKRNNFTKNAALERINSQMSSEEKIAKADENIENSGTIEEFYHAIDNFLAKLDKLSYKKVLRFNEITSKLTKEVN